MIVVTGATGSLGRLVVEELCRRIAPSSLVAGARTPENAADVAERGVVVRTLDYDRPDTVRQAIAGADRVLLISGSEVGRRVSQHQAVIDAAAAEGVTQLAYTSVLHADTSPLKLAAEHRATEEAIRAAGVPHTLLRHGWYVENYTENLAAALDHGTIVGSASDGRVGAATRADYAAAAAEALLGDGHVGQVYELAGTGFTMPEFAAALSAHLGRTITYTDLPPDEYRALLVGGGLPDAVADTLVDADLGVAAGALDESSATLERLIGRAPTSVEEALAAALP